MQTKYLIIAKPGSRHEKVEKAGKNTLRVSVKEPADKGKANKAIRKLLAKHFRIPESKIKLIGSSSKYKHLFLLS